MVTLLIATRNPHKVGEIRAILGDGFRYLSLDDLAGAPEVVEDAGTFAGNATKKAVALAKWLAQVKSPEANVAAQESETPRTQMYVLADDSGLEVDALDGAPGVHSARFAALDTGQPGNSPTADNNAKLLRLLENVPLDKRTARFRCVVALTPVPGPKPEGASPACYAEEAELETELYEGACEGRIRFALRGRGGFGYDPLFLPSGYDQTFGELNEAVKNQLSHRAKALAKLKQHLQPLSGSSPGTPRGHFTP
jgi:XTP/dITP diphosphohydrolase